MGRWTWDSAPGRGQDGDVDRIMLKFNQRRERVKTDDEFRRLLVDARVELEAFLKANPAHKDAARAAFHVAETYLSEQNFDKGRERLEAFLKEHPTSEQVISARFALGEIQLQKENDAEARAAFEEFLKHHPKDDRALFAKLYVALTFQNERKYDEAVQRLQAAFLESRGRKESWGAMMQLAVVYHVTEKPADARRTLEEIIRDCPDREPVEIARRHLAEYLKIGTDAPLFTEKDLDGRDVSLEKLRGRTVVLYFFDPGLNTSVTEAAFLKRAKADDVQFVGVNLNPDRRELAQFKAQMQVDWPIIGDPKGVDGRLARLYDVRGLPSLTVIDRKGRIRFFNIAGRDLRNALARLREEK